MTSAQSGRPKGSKGSKKRTPAYPKAMNPVRRTINKPTVNRHYYDPWQDHTDPNRQALIRDNLNSIAAHAAAARVRAAPPAPAAPPQNVNSEIKDMVAAADAAQGGRNRKARNGRTRRNKSNKGSRRGRMRSPRSFKSLFHF